MTVGPLQLIVVTSDNNDQFREQIQDRLKTLHGRGVIKLIDMVFVHKGHSGQLTPRMISNETGNEYSGVVLQRLLGLNELEEYQSADASVIITNGVIGITPTELQMIVERISPNTTAAVVLFEHIWAANLSTAIHHLGGHLLAQGFLTYDSAMVVNQEVKVTSEAQIEMETAEAVKGTMLLDTIVFAADVEEATHDLVSELVSAVAAETLRTLITAGFVDNAETMPALSELIKSGLLESKIVAEALQITDAIEREKKQKSNCR